MNYSGIGRRLGWLGVAPTVTFTYSVEPEVYETGDLEDLREFVPAHPSNLMMLQLDATGTVVAVGDPWLP